MNSLDAVGWRCSHCIPRRRYKPTLVPSFMEKRHHCLNNDMTFHLWDTPGGGLQKLVLSTRPSRLNREHSRSFSCCWLSGEDDPRRLAESCCKRAKACVVAYSSQDRQSFEAAELWVVMLRELCGPALLLALAHCKSDLAQSESSVTMAMAESLAAKPSPQHPPKARPSRTG